MTLYHISLYKRNDKNGLNLGGVEKFAYYLNRATGATLVSFYDFPEHKKYANAPDYEKASALVSWFSDIVTRDDIVVVDGYWGAGLESKVRRLVSVCHGSYYGRFIQHQLYPWGEDISRTLIEKQMEFWEEPRVEIVAVSGGAAQELYSYGIRKEIRVINNGVDLEAYRIMDDVEQKYLIHAATSALKGLDIINYLNNKRFYDIVFMNEFSGIFANEARRLNEAYLVFAPTRYEGCSYFLLESLACGIPVVTYAVGIALDFDSRCGVVTDDLYGIDRQLGYAIDRYAFSKTARNNAREWAVEHCSYEVFCRSWLEYLGGK